MYVRTLGSLMAMPAALLLLTRDGTATVPSTVASLPRRCSLASPSGRTARTLLSQAIRFNYPSPDADAIKPNGRPVGRFCTHDELAGSYRQRRLDWKRYTRLPTCSDCREKRKICNPLPSVPQKGAGNDANRPTKQPLNCACT